MNINLKSAPPINFMKKRKKNINENVNTIRKDVRFIRLRVKGMNKVV
jgi:hypothetical protein